MSHETQSELFENMTYDMLLNKLKQLDKMSPDTDEFGNELSYPNWRGCSRILIEKRYDGHTERQLDHNIDHFFDEVIYSPNLSNGSAIARVRDAGYLAYLLKPELFGKNNRGPFHVYVNAQYGISYILEPYEYRNVTELKQAILRNPDFLGKSIYDKNEKVIGKVVIKEQHLYKKSPKKLAKKYQNIEHVYDWYVINDCHC